MAVVLKKLILMNPRSRLGSVVLFVAGRPYTVDDAIASATFRGVLNTAIEETLALAAAEQSAAEEGLEVGTQALQAKADGFRHEHDLPSAGETEEWLEARGLTTDDFSGWLHQVLCRELIGSPNTSRTEPAVPGVFPDLLRVHLWLSGQMDEIAAQFSRRIAAGLEISKSGESLPVEAVTGLFLERHGLDESRLSGWLAALSRDRQWLEETLRNEAAFDRLASLATTDRARSRRLASMQRTLTRFEMETLELDSQAAAREALLCVRDDGALLSEVARESGYWAERSEIWAEMLDESVSQRLLSAAEGEAIGPIERNGRFKVYQVLRKLKPSLTDPDVVRRLDELIVEEFFRDLCARSIDARDAARIAK